MFEHRSPGKPHTDLPSLDHRLEKLMSQLSLAAGLYALPG